MCVFCPGSQYPTLQNFDKKTAAGMKERDNEEVEIIFFLIYEAQHKSINQNPI